MKTSPAKRRAAGVAGALLLLYPLGIAGRSFWREYAGFESLPAHVDSTAERGHLPALEDVSWPSGDGIIRGWFVPGTRLAAVVLVHGSGGNRTEVVRELEILSRDGFSVLAFDWPGHGESTGTVAWDAPERDALRRGIDWLQARRPSDVIGGYGFSLGTIPLVQVAAGDERIRAMVLAGAPPSYIDLARWEYRRHGFLAVQPAVLGMRAHGMQLDDEVPTRIIAEFAPRPLLMFSGERDVTVPPSVSRPLFDAAREPKAFVVVPGAVHGKYAEEGGAAYADRLRSFFENSLRDRRVAGSPP
ncbi:MAG TPA: alpha/beta hydrolase [Polyangiaceae bacterium]|jgi:pimeloyl-ACP methyl ester carboxylesterase